MYEETNLGPELDLTISLSDSDIDEILGIEHADIENLQDGYIDDAVDDFVEGSDRIPVKKKGLFSEIFKKSIKRRKPLDSVSEEDYPDEGILVDILAAEDPISLSEFNDILSNVFPDAEFEEEQIRMIEKALREYGIVLDEAENREKSAASSTNSPERPYFDFEGQDDPKIDKPSENPDMSQIEGSFFSNPEIQEDFDDYFRLTPDTKGQDISFLSYDKDQEVNNQEQKEDDRTEKLSMDDIEMVYPTREAKITVIDSDKSCFNSITDPVVNNATLDGNKETDIINKKIFDQINVISQGISADNYDKDSTPDGFIGSYVTDRDTVTGNGFVPVTFNDPELHRYYASVPEEVTALKYMEAAMDGQRASEKKEASEKEPDTPGIEEGVYVRNNDSFKTVDYSSARADVSFGDAGIPEKTVMDGSAPKTQTCAASLRRRDADRVADFKVNSGYEEYSENIGRIVCGNINHTTTDIESEVTKGARDLQSSELVWWARTILAPIGASSVRDSITADG
nr:hypothetical protein [Lachnospiraceae bacterium]